MSATHPTESLVDVGDATLAVRDTGGGAPAVVFLHYWGGSARTWQPIVDRLSPEHRCVTYNHRGWGSSTAKVDAFSIRDLAGDALALISALGLDEYVLVGHSMGGKTSQAVAATHPAGLRGAVLVAPAPAAPAAILPPETQEQLLSAYASRESVLGALENVLHAPISDELREQVVHDSLDGTPAATRAWPMEAFNEDVSDGVDTIDVPVLVVGADQDDVEPVSLMREHVIPSIRGARLEVISDCGHLIPLERPAELADRISAFLATLD